MTVKSNIDWLANKRLLMMCEPLLYYINFHLELLVNELNKLLIFIGWPTDNWERFVFDCQAIDCIQKYIVFIRWLINDCKI